MLLQKHALTPAKYLKHYSRPSYYVGIDQRGTFAKGDGEQRGWGSATDGETVGCRREETDLIFSSVTQSSEALVLADRLYDTVMLGSA